MIHYIFKYSGRYKSHCGIKNIDIDEFTTTNKNKVTCDACLKIIRGDIL